MNQNWGLAFFLEPNVITVINEINHNKKRLGEFFPRISQGLIAYDKYRGQDKKIIENRAYHHSTYQDGYKKWLWGEDVSRYSITWNGKEYIDYCEGIANPRNPIFFTNKRILVREITNPSIFAAITSEELYNDPAIINILGSGLYSIKATLAILNSKLAAFYHFNHSPKATKGAFPKILVQDIKEFPLPEISDKAKYVIEYLTDCLILLNDKTKMVDLGVVTRGSAAASLFDKALDASVYELYFTNEIQSQQVDVIELIADNLKQIDSLPIEKQIIHLFNEWNNYKNEIRNRVILQETRSKSVVQIVKSINS